MMGLTTPSIFKWRTRGALAAAAPGEEASTAIAVTAVANIVFTFI
jgi:hypothetical protein